MDVMIDFLGKNHETTNKQSNEVKQWLTNFIDFIDSNQMKLKVIFKIKSFEATRTFHNTTFKKRDFLDMLMIHST